MATDPNSAAVGGDAGTLSPPDEGQLSSDISNIESTFEPQIQAEEKTAEGYEEQASQAAGQEEQEAQAAAGELGAEDEEMQHWVDHTPTRQAAYATTMHAAPFLAILTAIGGKVTKLNGQMMLGAQTGMMQGLNEASEKKYNDALAAWQSAYDKMLQHQRRLMDAHKLMLDSYAGRADAYQKAAEAARRMTGDLLDDKQRQIAQKTDLFKAQSAAWDKLQRVNLANNQLAERVRHDMQEETKWKAMSEKAAAMPPEVKGQLAQEHQRWMNAKAQRDALLRRRGQVSASLDMPADMKTATLARIDDEDAALEMEQNRAVSNADAIIAGYTAKQGANAPGGKPNGAGGPPRTPPAAAPASSAPANLSRTNAKGWPLLKDDAGNLAYVGPNGEVEPVQRQNIGTIQRPGEPPGGAATPDNPQGGAGRPPQPPGQASDTEPAA